MSFQVPEKPAKPALVGLDWSKLKETLNPNFDWDAAVQAVLSRRYTLKKVWGLFNSLLIYS